MRNPISHNLMPNPKYNLLKRLTFVSKHISSKRILAGILLMCSLTALGALTGRTTLSMPWCQTNAQVSEKTSRAANQIATEKANSGEMSKSGTHVLVELFTSEGCSSCPSADRVLTDLKRDQPLTGIRVIALGEHVDYWNYIGWHDPFSSSAFTNRQYSYGKTFHLNSVYTPQAVVDGKTELLGSDRESLGSIIRNAARAPKAVVAITPDTGAAGNAVADANTVRVDISKLPAVHAGDTANVMLAITQDNLSNAVTRGENAGHTLPHTSVVRSLRRIGTMIEKSAFSSTVSLDLKIDWKRNDLDAVVFVQEHISGHILGANLLHITVK